MSADTANLTLPLACSYNERGVAGFTNTVTNGIDQKKVNSMYEPVRNAMTGAGTLYLAKRPGVVKNGTSVGVTGQVAYLIATAPASAISGGPWIFSSNGGQFRATDSLGTTTNIVATGSINNPAYSDRMPISGTDTIFVQFRTNDTTAQRVFYASVIGSWTEITDGDFTGLVHRGKMETMDGYLFTLDSLNRIYNSDLNSLANWTPTSFITKQIKQDYPRGLMKFNNQIIAGGDDTLEVFTNNGNPSGSPLVSQRSLFQRVGMAVVSGQNLSSYYYAVLLNKLYFIGRASGGNNSLSVFMYDGGSAQKISTPAIDKILSQESSLVYSIGTIGVNGKMAIYFALDPVTATTQRWLMYFPEWNDWFEWSSTVFCPVNNGEWFIGVGANQHRVYSFQSGDNWQDDGTSFPWQHQFKLPKADTAIARMRMYGLKGDTSRSASSVTVEASDDDWQTYSTLGTIDMTQIKKTNFQGGAYFDRGIRLSQTAAVDLRLESFLARIE